MSETSKVFLHVGCGGKRKEQTTRGFAKEEWQEVRLDIDPAVNPDGRFFPLVKWVYHKWVYQFVYQ